MGSPDAESIASVLERAAKGLRKCLRIIENILGDSPEEVRETLDALRGLTPAEIREAVRAHREGRR